jgi:exodeoxyribonuclease V alpha subunit
LHYDDASSSDWLETVVGQAVREFETVVEQAKNGSLLAGDIAHSRFRLLCALRKGRHGSEALNGLIKRRLAGERETWFPGRVVMVTENDPKRGLFNGDVGVAIRVEGKTKVAFPDYVSGSKPRLFEPFSLPNFEDAFATTIHKAQGSEAENIVLVFPPDDSPILSRELLYTGITRAKERLCIFAKPDVIARCLERSIHRASGLRKMLAS